MFSQRRKEIYVGAYGNTPFYFELQTGVMPYAPTRLAGGLGESLLRFFIGGTPKLKLV